MADADRCVHCGEIILEGRMACQNCCPIISNTKFPVCNAVDSLFSRNEIVALWWRDKKDRSHHLLWRGMAWDIPKRYKSMPFVKIFGTIPEHITQADTINIVIDVPAPAEERTKDD